MITAVKRYKGESLGGWQMRICQPANLEPRHIFSSVSITGTDTRTTEVIGVESAAKLTKELTGLDRRTYRRLIKQEISSYDPFLPIFSLSYSQVSLPELPDYFCRHCFYDDLEQGHVPIFRWEWSNPFAVYCEKHRCGFTKVFDRTHRRNFYKIIEPVFDGDLESVYMYLSQEFSINMESNFALSPMAQRIADLFSFDRKRAVKSAVEMNLDLSLDHLRQAFLAILFVLSYVTSSKDCIGEILFCKYHEQRSIFPKESSLSFHGFRGLAPSNKIRIYDFIGWLLCPKLKSPFAKIFHNKLFYPSGKLEGDREDNLNRFQEHPIFIVFYELNSMFGHFFEDKMETFFPTFYPTWISELAVYKAYFVEK